MYYRDIKQIEQDIADDIKEISKYPEAEHYIQENYQMRLVHGEMDDNSIDLDYDYRMLKSIDVDPSFLSKLSFVLNKYVSLSKIK